MNDMGTLDGPLGLVGAGYIGHLFTQQFALAGYEVRAWSPGDSARTLPDRLRQSLAALAEIGAVDASAVNDVVARVSVHDELGAALEPCGAVMESVVEDAEVKMECYREIEASVASDALLWSATSNFPMTRLAAGMTRMTDPWRPLSLPLSTSTRSPFLMRMVTAPPARGRRSA